MIYYLSKFTKRIKSYRGFTLIELLVVISIITILSVVGMAIFTGVQKGARDARKKGDIDSIAKAAEVQYDPVDGYSLPQDSWFTAGKIPTPPEGGSYTYQLNAGSTGFQVCAPLEDNPPCSSPSETCFCQQSRQGVFIATGPTSTPTPTSGGTPIPTNTPTPTNMPTNTPTPTPAAASCPSTGLKAHYKMDEASWTNNCSTITVLDYSGNGNNGLACPNATGPTGGAIGKINFAGSFDGTNDYVDMGNILEFTNGQFITIAAWIKPSVSQTKEFIGKKYNYDFAITNTQQLLFGYYPGGGVDEVYQSPASAITIGSWNHVAVTYNFGDGGSIRMYINGVFQPGFWTGTGDVAPPLSTYTLQIGGKDTYAGDYFNGLIDDVRIYDWALSQTDISNLYNDGIGCIP